MNRSPHGNSVVLVAAGRGTRMGPGIDKLFLEIAGRPIVAHTWLRFDGLDEVDEIVVVVREGLEGDFRALALEHGIRKPFTLVRGGAERQDSVWNGLQAVSAGCEIVAIQDGARPCTSVRHIREILAGARETGAAVAAQRVVDTIKESIDGRTIHQHLDRSRLWAVQTPQAFRLETIRRALTEVRRQGLQVTDDTAACACIGQAVRLVEGLEPNPKATAPGDLTFLSLLLADQTDLDSKASAP